jgi:hypothetical protein
MSRTIASFKTPARATARGLRAGNTLTRRDLMRWIYAALIVLFAAISVFTYRAAERKHRDLAAANDASAWRQSGAVATASLSLDAFVSTWGAQRTKNSTQTTLTWSVRDTRDLRASLLALDATKASTQRIDVTRREAGFTIVAEIAQ